MGRLFFAVWPGAVASRELALVAESLAELAGGRPTPREKIHMTLAFLGSLDADGAGRAAGVAARVSGGAIRMTIDQVGSFRRARVGWAASSVANAELAGLQERLARELAGAGFALEDRAFMPHVTLARKIGKPVPRAPMPPVEWQSRAFTLVESTGRGGYEVLESWELR
ncbi:MAG TPA: RNA 2',3'-cyclic phosphodiesterase [Usitatibacter sp.]|nr:RNA 2',3'-cyclic phosphodiesterase [Usitatibacter sp.]